MTEKKERIIGIVLFSSLLAFALWYVDLSNISRFEVNGFGINPHGYGSFAEQLISALLGGGYGVYKKQNAIWVLTQLIPLAIAWPMRETLGKFVASLSKLVKKVYGEI